VVRVKPTKLLARWSKRLNDMLYSYPSKPDGGWLHSLVSWTKGPDGDSSLIEELKARGYDVKTLRISVDVDPEHPRWNRDGAQRASTLLAKGGGK
jgi:hypothetical protein